METGLISSTLKLNIHSFLTMELDKGKWSVTLWLLHFLENSPCFSLNSKLVGPKSCYEMFWRKEKSLPHCWKSNSLSC